METAKLTLGVIGGSSFYAFDNLEQKREIPVPTPFGPTPDPVVEGWIDNIRLLFVSRHGQGHRLLPSEVPYQAIIFALKKLGAERVIGVSAVGSLREDIRPGDLVVVRQFVDATYRRPNTFFGQGIVAHVGFGDPVCANLAEAVYQEAKSLGFDIHRKATLKVMEGPQFSTRAESETNCHLGYDLIGMTSLPEAKVAREAELCYVTLALVTDYDCWHRGEEDVTAEMVTKRLAENAAKAREVIRRVAIALPAERKCPCPQALDTALVTDPANIPKERREALAPILDRVLKTRGL